MTASHGKRVGFVELFFDLVFVFAVTQLVGVLHADHGAAGWGRTALLLWLVWWAWSQFAWTGNAIDLDRRPVRLVVLVASLAMLAAAVALPQAFGDDAAAFAVPYAAVRLAGLALSWIGLAHDAAHRAALRTYLPVALVGPALVLVGGLAGEADHRRRGNLARDLYTLGHLPIVAGIVVFVVAVEEALLHPAEPLHGLGVTALAVGPVLFLAGFVAGNRRAAGTWLWPRVAGIGAAAVVALAVGPSADPVVSLGLLAVVIAAVAVAESSRHRSLATAPG